jgi:hypothetical protein
LTLFFLQTFLSLGSAVPGAAVSTEVHQAYMGSLFDHIVGKFEVAIQVRAATAPGPTTAANTTASSNTAASSGTDGMSAIAMLAVLSDFEASFREAMIIQYVSKNSTANQRSRKLHCNGFFSTTTCA